MIEMAVTLDVEQWDPGDKEKQLDALLESIDGHPTTWFVAEDETQSTSGRYPRVVRAAMDAGHEVAAHVHFQTNKPDRQRQNVRDATTRLRDAGAASTSFRGGGHVFNDSIAAELVVLGYRVDSSAVPGLVRTYPARGGTSVAAFGDVWSCRPYWWCAGLLELPTAAFPLRRPRSFFRRRFRLPLLLDQPHVFVDRLLELKSVHGDDDLAVVMMGHSFDVDTPAKADRLRASMGVLTSCAEIQLRTVATLGDRIRARELDVRVGQRPSGVRRWIGGLLETGVVARSAWR